MVNMKYARFPRRTRGFVLVTVMVLLALLASMGVAAMRSTLLELQLFSALGQARNLEHVAAWAIECELAAIQHTGAQRALLFGPVPQASPNEVLSSAVVFSDQLSSGHGENHILSRETIHARGTNCREPFATKNGMHTPSAQSASAALVHANASDIQAQTATHYCGARAPLSTVATDSRVVQAQYFVSTAAAYRSGTKSYRLAQQGWVQHQPSDPSFLPALPRVGGIHACDKAYTLSD